MKVRANIFDKVRLPVGFRQLFPAFLVVGLFLCLFARLHRSSHHRFAFEQTYFSLSPRTHACVHTQVPACRTPTSPIHMGCRLHAHHLHHQCPVLLPFHLSGGCVLRACVPCCNVFSSLTPHCTHHAFCIFLSISLGFSSVSYLSLAFLSAPPCFFNICRRCVSVCSDDHMLGHGVCVCVCVRV